MTQILYGERIGKEGKIRLGCSAIIFDDDGRFLLTRRADNGQWCLPDGGLEPGESVEEACAREVLEETSLYVKIKRLIGVYSNRDQLVIYPDGAKFQIIALHFEAESMSGALGVSAETTAFGYYSLEEIKDMDIIHSHRERIMDSLDDENRTIVR